MFYNSSMRNAFHIAQLNRIGENGHGVWDFGNSLSVGVE